MSDARAKLTLLEQREIEARIVGPLIEAVRAELGAEKTLALVRRVIAELARQSGAELARSLGEASLPALARCLDRWSEQGALEIDVLEQSADRLSFNVTRCRYAEFYQELGEPELGFLLVCSADFELAEGFGGDIALTRYHPDHIFPADHDLTAGYRFQPGDHPHGCGFSATRRADEHHKFTLGRSEVKVFYG